MNTSEENREEALMALGAAEALAKEALAYVAVDSPSNADVMSHLLRAASEQASRAAIRLRMADVEKSSCE